MYFDGGMLGLRQQAELIRADLYRERSSFMHQWRDLNDFIDPSKGRFFITDTNRGDRRNLNILNSAGTQAARTLHAGMMSGITSPARRWFRLAAPDPDVNEYGPVKEWLDLVGVRMAGMFLRSNLYKVLPYRTLGVFGTAPFSVEELFGQNELHFQQFPVGSYCIAVDEYGKVNVFYQEYAMTVRNLVSRFGRKDNSGNVDWSNISLAVRNQYERGNYEAWVSVAHIIMPNRNHKPGSPFAKHKKFRQLYYERGFINVSGKNYSDKFDSNIVLADAGFDYFPVLCPRWQVTGTDAYATDCPGMTALGDIKELQHGERAHGQALDVMVRPPMVFPTELQNQSVSLIPGGKIWADIGDGRNTIRSAYDVNLRIDHLDLKMQKVEQRISRAFYENLFLMLANDNRNDRATAREIDERHEEKLLALGPVLEQMNDDVLDPLIDISFEYMMRKGMVPPPPEVLQGQNLKVEYMSIMAQAQKMVGVNTHERFLSSVMNAANVDPTIMHKIDLDQWVDVFGEQLSVTPGVIRSDDQVAAMRDEMARAAQAEQAAQNLPNMARAAKDLSQAETEGDNALSELINQAEATGQEGEVV